jgi:hypothetical protein
MQNDWDVIDLGEAYEISTMKTHGDEDETARCSKSRKRKWAKTLHD